jgi:hypothetical protein
VTKIVILDDFCHRSLLLSIDSLQTPAKAMETAASMPPKLNDKEDCYGFERFFK